LENEIQVAEKMISNPAEIPTDISSDDFYKNYSALKTELQTLEKEWEELHLKLEELES